MTLYSSGKHDKLTDPRPWVAWDIRYPSQIGSAYWEPRPELERPLTNPANPILATFRADPERGESWIVSEYLYALDEYQYRPETEFDEDGDLRLATYYRVSRCGATVAHIVHARRVLEKITVLDKNPRNG